MSSSDDAGEMHLERMDRPPSSYGSMMSDEDPDEELEQLEDHPLQITPALIKPGISFHRPDSPETTFTERTHSIQFVLNNRVFLNKEESPSNASKSQASTSAAFTGSQCDPRTMEEAQNHRQTPPHTRRTEELDQAEKVAVDAQQEAPESEDDYDEMIVPFGFNKPTYPPPLPPEGTGLQFLHTHCSLTLPYVLTAMVRSLHPLNRAELAYFKRSLCSHYKFDYEFSSLADLQDALDVADKVIELCGLGDALCLTVSSLQSIGKTTESELLRKTCRRAIFQHDLKQTIYRRYYHLYEGRCRPGQQRYISDVYVEPLTVIRGSADPVNPENEVRQISYPFPTAGETVIRAADIFRPLPGDSGTIRTVITTGIPACGLTVAMTKFVIDWMEGTTNQDFQLVFPLLARELHLGKNVDQTFLEVLNTSFPEASHIRFIEKEDCSSLFIIDALELCQYPLDFQSNETVTSIKTKASVDVLLTSLIRGLILPQARVWITSNITATHKIPPCFVDRFVELKGFTDEQKQLYFTKRFTNPDLGAKILNHVRRSKALEIICHLPLFSWVVAYLFEILFRDPKYGKDPPGITTLYAQFVIVQMNRSFERNRVSTVDAQKWYDEDKMFLENIGRLAFRMLQQKRDWFNVEDLLSVDLKYDDLRSRDELTTEVQRTSDDPHTWVFKFIHYTILEYLAAMYVYVAFRKHGKNLFESSKNRLTKLLYKEPQIIELYRLAVDNAVASQDGHFDMFLRFLVGLVTPGTDDNLRPYLLHHRFPKPKEAEEVFKYLNKKIRENIHPDRKRNLELCLVELEVGKDR